MTAALIGREVELGELVEACASGAGVLVSGPAGVGKSRLLDALGDARADAGDHVERFTASAAARPLPLGALVAILPDPPPGDRTQLLRSALDALAGRADDRALLVTVDDAHLLDDLSLALLAEAIHRRTAVLALTTRSGEPVPPALAAIRTEGRLRRHDLRALEAGAVRRLATEFLGGPIADELGVALVERADGNPLLLRELLLDALAAGAVSRVGDRFGLRSPLTPGRRIGELVASRVAALAPLERAALERIALGEPLDLELLADTDRDRVLDELERRELVTVGRADDRWQVRTDHPLIGETVRAGVSPRRRAELLGDVAARLERLGRPARGDALRSVRWSDEAGLDLGADVLAAAAREALAGFDLEQAERLARRATERDAPADAYLALGQVLRVRGGCAEAARALAEASARAVDDGEIVAVAMARSSFLAFQAGDPHAAIAALERAADRVADPARALELRSESSLLATLLGRYGDVRRTSRAVLGTLDADSHARWTARVNLAYAEVMLGLGEDVDEHVEAALALEGEIRAERPHEVDLLWAMRGAACLLRGDLTAGERALAAHVARCRATGEYRALGATVLLQLRTLLAAPDATEPIPDALAQIEWMDAFGAEPVTIGSAALALAQTLDLDGAAALLDRGDDHDALPWSRVWRARAHAAVLAGRGDLDGAARAAAAAGTECVTDGHVAYGVLALHDAVRYGRPELLGDSLDVLTGTESLLLRVVADHAAALARGDAKGLDAVADELLAMPAPVLAVSALAQAARLHAASDDGTAARRSAARAAAWSRRAAPHVAVGASADLEPVDGAMTQRELDGAVLAARGLTSREIAERLFVSVRTVDNHLRAVYAKLGLRGRDELPGALDPLPAIEAVTPG